MMTAPSSMPRSWGVISAKEHAEQKTQENGQAAHAWNGMVVHTAFILGYVHRPTFKGQDLTTGVATKAMIGPPPGRRPPMTDGRRFSLAF